VGHAGHGLETKRAGLGQRRCASLIGSVTGGFSVEHVGRELVAAIVVARLVLRTGGPVACVRHLNSRLPP